MKQRLHLISIFLVTLLFLGCGDSSEESKKEASPTVEAAFEQFNAYNFSTGSDDVLIAQVKSTLENPKEGDNSPDIETALAIVELFEITKDPLIKGIVNISIENYETVVADVMKQFTENRFSFAFGEGISLSAPETAHKTATSFKHISDALGKSFTSKNYVFEYWGENGLDYEQAQAIRVVLLGVASQLELLSAYSFGTDACYIEKSENGYPFIEAQVDPASVLNGEVCGDVLVYKDSTSNREKLNKAKSLILESFDIAKEVDTTGLPTNESFTADDYDQFQSYIPDLIKNLNGEEDVAKIKYDGGLIAKIIMKIDLRVLYNPETVIDTNDVTRFTYICSKKSDGENYSREQSIIAGRPMCANSTANLWIDSAPKVAISDLDNFVQSAQWLFINYDGQDLLDLVYKELKPNQN